MKQSEFKLENNIKAHIIKTEFFKTDLLAVFLVVPLNRNTVTYNALIPAVLKRGTQKLKTQNDINKKLEEMYGAIFDCGLDKSGDNLILKFYLESINDSFLPGENNNLENAINLLIELIFNPLVENDSFKKEYVDQEKKNLQLLIESKKDNKDRYALDRCINIMYGDNGYGLNKLGYIEDFEKINEKNLYTHYLNLLKTAKIDIFVSGNFEEEKVLNTLEKNEILKTVEKREVKYSKNDYRKEIKEKVETPKQISDSMEVMQGKLVIGLDILPNNLGDYRYVALLYNTILGDSANSKLFQNVREKASLAYTAKSNYIKQKNNIFIRCGIEIENYEKALNIIKEQLEDMKSGKFSDEDILNSKNYIISGLKAIDSEQDTGIIYSFGQEMSEEKITPEEYKNKINCITKEQIVELANNININTIYFLRS